MKKIFSNQLPSGQIPTLMVNQVEGHIRVVDTLAITMVVVYLSQLHPQWRKKWGREVEKALGYIESCVYMHEIEGFGVYHFNAFYPPDWEDTAMAVYLLNKSGRLKVSGLKKLRELFVRNSVHENGTGVWVKDSYSKDNSISNAWDPTSALNILRLHYLFETGKDARKVERFILKNLVLEQFGKATLYYRAPLAAFFGKRLVEDFPDETIGIRKLVEAFHDEVKAAIVSGKLTATPFEKVLLGISTRKQHDQGLIFHHSRRDSIWYGSPILFQLAKEVIDRG